MPESPSQPAVRARDRYDSLIRYYAEQYRLPWWSLKAQMLAESAANPDAMSPVGALGLTQFMAQTWREWWDGTPGIQGTPRWNPTNPEAALRAQAAYMRWLLNRVGGDYRQALAAYNWGIGNLRKCTARYGVDWRQHLPRETTQYLARIARYTEKMDLLESSHA